MLDALLEWFGFGLCHQLPERSFFGGGTQVPVCARDTGIYLGFVISLLIITAIQRNRPTGLPSAGVSVLLVIMIGFMALDGLTSYAGIRATSNALRLLSGLAAGYAMGAVALPLINDELWRTAARDRVLPTTRILLLWLASLGATFVVTYWLMPHVGVAYPLVVVAAVLGTLTAVNLLIILLPSRFNRRFERLREAWVPLLLAFVLAWVEIVLSALLKFGLASLVS